MNIRNGCEARNRFTCGSRGVVMVRDFIRRPSPRQPKTLENSDPQEDSSAIHPEEDEPKDGEHRAVLEQRRADRPEALEHTRAKVSLEVVPEESA
jgi:hypothetical protein